ncbi:MAG: hypothetical protein HGA96_15045 [Desulfobulbaceae bacterium]|nr:hypothetical protein [Desulfobulbaceae bacterium]
MGESKMARRMDLAGGLNGMRLHEYFYDPPGEDGIVNSHPKLARENIENFGSIWAWQKGQNDEYERSRNI